MKVHVVTLGNETRLIAVAKGREHCKSFTGPSKGEGLFKALSELKGKNVSQLKPNRAALELLTSPLLGAGYQRLLKKRGVTL